MYVLKQLVVESESADGLVTQPQTFILREHTNEKIKAHAHKREIEPPLSDPEYQPEINEDF